jgi:hypothetical protein
MNLHNEMFPRLHTWQQNFLMLNNLQIRTATKTGIDVVDSEERSWHLLFSSTLAGWVAQYKGKTFHKPREIKPYDPRDWIKL